MDLINTDRVVSFPAKFKEKSDSPEIEVTITQRTYQGIVERIQDTLGRDLPLAGTFKKENGREYYIWE